MLGDNRVEFTRGAFAAWSLDLVMAYTGDTGAAASFAFAWIPGAGHQTGQHHRLPGGAGITPAIEDTGIGSLGGDWRRRNSLLRKGPPLATCGSQESMEHPALTSAVVSILRGLGLPADRLEPVESYSHAVWLTKNHAVHYHVIGAPGRLEHEARVGLRLPPEALYPRVVAVGRDGEHDWLVTERARGVTIPEAWPSMTRQEGRSAVFQAAAALRAVHHSPVKDLAPPCLQGDAPTFTRRAILDELAARGAAGVSPLLAAFDDRPTVMAHGDFNFNQVIWHEGRVTALLDLEMSHVEAPDWDLGPFLGFCADPARAVPARIENSQRPEDYQEAPRWLKEAYPAMFDYPRLRDRLLVQSLVFRAEELLTHPDRAEWVIGEAQEELRLIEPMLDS